MKYLLICAVIIFSACSSRSLQRDYVVVDSSHQEVPEWVEDIDEWIDDEEDDSKDFRYYTYSSTPKNDRQIACELSSARAASQVASEVSQFIRKNLASSISGDPNNSKESLDQYIEENLYKEVEAKLVGVREIKTYWEKRRFQKDLGAKKNRDAYTCTKLLKVSKKNLKKLFDMTYESLESREKVNEELKTKVQKIMEEAKKDYTN